MLTTQNQIKISVQPFNWLDIGTNNLEIEGDIAAVKKVVSTVGFLIDGKLILEVKAKRLVAKEDFYQLQRYL